MKIINGLKYWGQLLLLPLYWLSFLVPRDKKLWLFGSTFGKRFADNPRYLYLYASQNGEKLGVRPVWISHDKQIVAFLDDNGYEAYYYHSVKGIWLALRAKVYVFDNYSKDINFWQSGGAVKVNLWHGNGNKKTNYDNRFDKARHPKNLCEKWKYFPRRLSDEKPSHYVLATSEHRAEIFSSAFRIPKDHVIIDGYPRNDVLFEDCAIKFLYTEEEKSVIDMMRGSREKGYKVILYMPTFRESESKFFDVMDLGKFNEFLKKNNYMFYTKLHPKSKLLVKFEEINYSNIVNVSSDVDAYTILKLADILTTDYSSVHTDYILLNRPSVIFAYDLKEYSENTRDCYYDYGSYMPEIRTYTMEEFMDGIMSVADEDKCVEGRMKLLRKMWKYADSKSSERIIQKIKKII